MLSTGRARQSFLEVVSRLAPWVLEKLRGDPLQVFIQARASFAPYSYDLSSLKELSRKLFPKDPGSVAIQKAVEVWSISCNLNASWVHSSAYSTLEAWRSGQELMEFYLEGRNFVPATSIADRKKFIEQLVSFLISSNFMGYETASNFRKRVNDIIEPHVENHIKEQESRAPNYLKYPDKRKPELHFEWAVLYQVCGMSADTIAHKYEKADMKEVRRQIRNILEGVLEFSSSSLTH